MTDPRNDAGDFAEMVSGQALTPVQREAIEHWKSGPVAVWWIGRPRYLHPHVRALIPQRTALTTLGPRLLGVP